MDTILTHVSKLRLRLNIKTRIKVLQWTDFGDEDCLYFLDHGFHYNARGAPSLSVRSVA